jgi:hypothetical protein
MGIGTGGVVCSERAMTGSLYCRHCNPVKKLAELRNAYDRLWSKLIPHPDDLQPELGDRHHSRLMQAWTVVHKDGIKKGLKGDKLEFYSQARYLDRAITYCIRHRTEDWERIESYEDDIKELEDTIAADKMIDALNVDEADMVDPNYPPLPHEVESVESSASGPRVYRCHVVE